MDTKTRNLSIIILILSLATRVSAFMNSIMLTLLAFLVLAIYLVYRSRGEIVRKDIGIGLVFGLLSPIMFMYEKQYLIGVLYFLITCLGYMGSAPTLRKYLGDDNLLNKNLAKSILFGVGFGAILAAINLGLGSTYMDIAFKISAKPILSALSPAIFEEIPIRSALYALGLMVLAGKPQKKSTSILLYILMVFPHALGHAEMDIFTVLINSLIFGLPLAILQRKVDLSSALIMHFVVDAVRFVAFGG